MFQTAPEGLSVKELQVPTYVIDGETGVLLKQGSDSGTKVRLFKACEGVLDNVLFKPGDGLREGQVKEIAEWHTGANYPVAKKAGLTAEQVTSKVREAQQKKKAAEAARLEAESAAAAAPAPSPVKEAEADEEDDEDAVEEIVTACPLLGKQADRKQSGKGKRGKGKGKGKKGKGLVSLTMSSRAGPARDEETHLVSPAEKQRAKAKEWLRLLDLSKALAGESIGKEIWGCEQTIKAMQERQNMDNPEYLLLSSHLELAKAVKDHSLALRLLLGLSSPEYNKDNLLKKSGSERAEVFAYVQKLKDASVVFPAIWQASLVVYAAKHHTGNWAEIACPWRIDGRWDAAAPRLSTSGLSYTDRAKVFTKVTIHERLLGLIVKGEEGTLDLKRICEEIRKVWADAPADADAVLSATVEEVAEIADFLLTLSNPDMNRNELVETLDAVMADRGDNYSPKQLIQKAVAQTSYWGAKEKTLRKNYMAMQVVMPEVRRVVTNLQSTTPQLEEAAKQIPYFRDSVPRDWLQECFDAFKVAVMEEMTKLIQKNDEKGISVIKDTVLAILSDVPDMEWVEEQRQHGEKALWKITEGKVMADSEVVLSKGGFGFVSAGMSGRSWKVLKAYAVLKHAFCEEEKKKPTSDVLRQAAELNTAVVGSICGDKLPGIVKTMLEKVGLILDDGLATDTVDASIAIKMFLRTLLLWDSSKEVIQSQPPLYSIKKRWEYLVPFSVLLCCCEVEAQVSALIAQLEIEDMCKELQAEVDKPGMETGKKGQEEFLNKHSKQLVALSAKVSALKGEGRGPLVSRAEAMCKKCKGVASDVADVKMKSLLSCSDAVDEARAWKKNLDRKVPWVTARESLMPILQPAGSGPKLQTAVLRAEGMYKAITNLVERFGSLPAANEENLKASKTLLGQACVTLVECNLASIVEDNDLTASAKQSKIRQQYEKVSAQSRQYGYDIKAELLPCLVSKTVGKLME
eukprot:6487784-Amphidinium_carterae.2